MTPVNFKYQNQTLSGRPLTPNDPDSASSIDDLPVWTDGNQYVSLWKMSLKERFSALFWGHVYVNMLGKQAIYLTIDPDYLNYSED